MYWPFEVAGRNFRSERQHTPCRHT